MGTWLRTVRAASGFFDQALLKFLEGRQLPYIVVVGMTSTLQQHCAGIQDWTRIDEHHDAGQFTVKLFGWTQERRFVVVRERVRESKTALGRELIYVPGCTFRGWVTNRSEGALELWRDYNQRACMEQRIEELKGDLAALTVQFCPCAVIQPFYRFTHTRFETGTQEDCLHSAALDLYYSINQQLSVRFFGNFERRESDNPLAEYRKADAGGGVNFTLRI